MHVAPYPSPKGNLFIFHPVHATTRKIVYNLRGEIRVYYLPHGIQTFVMAQLFLETKNFCLSNLYYCCKTVTCLSRKSVYFNPLINVCLWVYDIFSRKPRSGLMANHESDKNAKIWKQTMEWIWEQLEEHQSLQTRIFYILIYIKQDIIW